MRMVQEQPLSRESDPYYDLSLEEQLIVDEHTRNLLVDSTLLSDCFWDASEHMALPLDIHIVKDREGNIIKQYTIANLIKLIVTTKSNPNIAITFQEMVALLVQKNRYSNQLGKDEMRELCARALFYYFRKIGRFLYDKDHTLYYFHKSARRMYRVSAPSNSDENIEFRGLLGDMGMNTATKRGQLALRWVIDNGVRYGVLFELHQFCHWEQNTKTLYLFNGEYRVFKLTGDRIEILWNGDDGVFFPQNVQDRVITYDPAYISRKDTYQFHGCFSERDTQYLFQRLASARINFAVGTLTDDQFQFLYDVYFLSVVFQRWIHVLPGVLFMGDTGSGKTVAHKYLRKFFLNGSSFMIPSKVDDFQVVLNNNQLANFENVDSNYNREFTDIICSVITQSEFQKRKLYADNTPVTLSPRVALILDARTPQFLRADVVNRFLYFPLAAFQDDFGAMHMKSDKVFFDVFEDTACMSDIWSEYLELCNRMVKKIRELKYASRKEYPIRTATFAIFLELAADLFGKDQPYVDELLQDMAEMQQAITLEGSQLEQLIPEFKKSEKYLEGEVYTATKLHKLLQEEFGKRYSFKTPISLGKALSERKAGFYKKYGFVIDQQRRGSKYWFETYTKPHPGKPQPLFATEHTFNEVTKLVEMYMETEGVVEVEQIYSELSGGHLSASFENIEKQCQRWAEERGWIHEPHLHEFWLPLNL